jgi:hypothetical protein
MCYLVLRRDLGSQEVESIDRSWRLHLEAHAVVQTWLQMLLSFIGEVMAPTEYGMRSLERMAIGTAVVHERLGGCVVSCLSDVLEAFRASSLRPDLALAFAGTNCVNNVFTVAIS